jgi:hypothetical protein
LLLTATVTLANPTPPPVRDVSDFYEPLSAHGYWVRHERGWCWRPHGVAADWQPFRNGRWLWTAQGWYWESPEPWAWAVYHYGRWFWDDREGWLWLPDVQWLPASVVEARVVVAPPPPPPPAPPAPVIQHYTYIERIEPVPVWYFHFETRRYVCPPPPCCCPAPCARHRRPPDRCEPPPSCPRRDGTVTPAPAPRDPPAEQPRPPRRPPMRLDEAPPNPPPTREVRAAPAPPPRPVVTEPVSAKRTPLPPTVAYRQRAQPRAAEKLAKDLD